jgi:DNA-binding transcriptional MerR regulator
MAQVGGGDGIHSLAETARRVGIGVETLQRLAEAAQLGERLFSDEDVETFAGMKVALEAGFPEDALTQLLRGGEPPFSLLRLRTKGARRDADAGRPGRR